MFKFFETRSTEFFHIWKIVPCFRRPKIGEIQEARTGRAKRGMPRVLLPIFEHNSNVVALQVSDAQRSPSTHHAQQDYQH
jgi:hypothetical protein